MRVIIACLRSGQAARHILCKAACPPVRAHSHTAATDFATAPCKAETTSPPTRAIEASAPVEFSETLTHKRRDGHREARPTRPSKVAYQCAPRVLSTTNRDRSIRS